jgi:hypothetical protein
LPGSILLGFTASLPGKEVPEGASWPWTGELIRHFYRANTEGCFTFVKVVEFDGEPCAKIVGKAGRHAEDAKPPLLCELYFSLKRKIPVSGSLSFDSSSRVEKWQVKVKDPAKKKTRPSRRKPRVKESKKTGK